MLECRLGSGELMLRCGLGGVSSCQTNLDGSCDQREILRGKACHLIDGSRGIPVERKSSDPIVRHMAGQLAALGFGEVLVHDDEPARLAAATLGTHAFCYGGRIFLGPTVGSELGPSLNEALRHEIVHVAQVRKGLLSGEIATHQELESEADRLAALERPDLGAVKGAAAGEIYSLLWFLPLAAAAYVLLRPNVANAPGPGDETYPSVSDLQVVGEAFAIFAVPGGAFALGGRLGLGFYGSSALAGAGMTTSFRAAQDLGQGQFSGVQVYVFDAVTGAVIGVIVPGGVRLIGQAGTRSLDWLATRGMTRAGLEASELIASRAATRPLAQAEVEALLRPRGFSGRMADWWLNRRGSIMLYRGQGEQTVRILSPIAREQGVAASEAMVARMRAAGLTNEEIAAATAKWHTQPVPPYQTVPQLVGEPLGAAGIPTTRIPGVAANFGDSGVVYIVRVPQGSAIRVPEWGLAVENEWVVLNQIPEEWIVGILPASRIPALQVNPGGLLVPAR